MTQFKRKKRRFETPIWALQVSLVACLALWLFVMLAPFSSHDAAIERNGVRKDSLLHKEQEAHQAEQASVNLAAAKKAFSLTHKNAAAVADARNKAEEAAEAAADDDGKGDDAMEGDDDAIRDNSKDQDGDDDGGNLDEEGDDNEGGENNEEGEGDDGGNDDGEEDEEGGNDDGAEEAIQRRLSDQEGDGDDEDNGKEMLVSKRFVFELENLSDGDSSGKLIVESRPTWSPLGAAHFHELVENGFYDQCRFFRVVPNFIVQFGINADPKVQKYWRNQALNDDPPNVKSNDRGTLVYATAGPNTRTTQLFVNLRDNPFLDRQGFTPFAVVIEGMEHVDRINKEYGEDPGQGEIQIRGNEYLNENFPNLSYVVTAYEDAPEEGGN